MSAQGIDIAKAFVTDCEAATWPVPCQFERRYLAIEELPSLDKTLVQVAYAGQRAVPSSRSSWRHEYDIDVAVMRKLLSDDNHEADRYSDLLDLIVDEWKSGSPTGTGATLKTIEWIQVYIPEHLRTQRTFTGVVRFTFELVRA